MAFPSTPQTKSVGAKGMPATQAAWWVSILSFAILLGLMLPTLSGGVRGEVPGSKSAKQTLAPQGRSADFPGPIRAEDYQPETVEPPSLGDIGVKLIMAMAMLVGMGAGLVVLAKKMALGPQAGRSNGKMTLVDTLSLGRRCELHLVEIEGIRVLVGVDPAGMRSVTHLPEDYRDLSEGENRAVNALQASAAVAPGHPIWANPAPPFPSRAS